MKEEESPKGYTPARNSIFLLIALVAWSSSQEPVFGQEVRTTRLENGLLQLESEHLQLLTDVPLNDEISMLPKIFDQAVELWSKRFAVDISKMQGAKAVAYLINDRARFVQLDLMPSDAGNFRQGYQLDDRLFLMEQPSDYYRRHLLLHEGTHWFLWKYLQVALTRRWHRGES